MNQLLLFAIASHKSHNCAEGLGDGTLRAGGGGIVADGIAGCGVAPGRPGTATAGRPAVSAGLIMSSNSSAISAPRTVRRSTIVRRMPNAARHGTARNRPRNV